MPHLNFAQAAPALSYAHLSCPCEVSSHKEILFLIVEIDSFFFGFCIAPSRIRSVSRGRMDYYSRRIYAYAACMCRRLFGPFGGFACVGPVCRKSYSFLTRRVVDNSSNKQMWKRPSVEDGCIRMLNPIESQLCHPSVSRFYTKYIPLV